MPDFFATAAKTGPLRLKRPNGFDIITISMAKGADNIRKQLILVSDMEGASGIFERDHKMLWNGETEAWRGEGRRRMTSDVLAVCEAARAFGIDEVYYYDMHNAGNPESNVLPGSLPDYVRLPDVPNRDEIFLRRIREGAQREPFGIITVGQHARAGTEDAYFPHTIQTPPVKNLWCNGLHIAEIGVPVLAFSGTPYLANIGCAASMREAKELCPQVECITVKDKARGFEPPCEETYPMIYEGVLRALARRQEMQTLRTDGAVHMSMALCDGWHFEPPEQFPWKGSFSRTEASWEALTFFHGFEIWEAMRLMIKKD